MVKKKPGQLMPESSIGLGDKLRALREERGLTLKEMGSKSEISFTYLSEIERGTVVPSVETVKQLAKFFGVPVSAIVSNHLATSLPGKLQYIRKLRNLSQKELAVKAGVSPGLVAQLELGKVNASLKTVKKLADSLGVSPCYLIMDSQTANDTMAGISPELRALLGDPTVQAVIGSICTLNESQLRLILNFINMVKNPIIP